MALTFILGTPCPGGNHWDVKVSIDSFSVTFPIAYPELQEPLTDEELTMYADLALRYAVSTQPGNVPMATVRNRLASASFPVKL